MADKKLPDLQDRGLGDLTHLMHNQSVSDLSWLDIDPEEYRRQEALPKQNLDMIPELAQALSQEEDGVPQMIPLRPQTIVNTNPLEYTDPVSPRSGLGVDPRKVEIQLAHHIMAGLSDSLIEKNLKSEFSSSQIRSASVNARQLLGERHLLGKVYINASHFPRCAQRGSHKDFVRKHASKALYVLAKDECNGCVHNNCGNCSVFKKRIVSSVPYDEYTFAHYLTGLVAEKRLIPEETANIPTDSEGRKKLLELGFSRSPAFARSVQTIQYQNTEKKTDAVTMDDIRGYMARQASRGPDPMPSSIYLVAAKKLQHGVISSDSLAASSNPEIRKLASEYGIIGHTYLDADALGGCAAALDFINKKRVRPSFVLLRSTDAEVSSKPFTELAQITKVTANYPKLGKEHLINALELAVTQNRISAKNAQSVLKKASDDIDWPSLIAQVNLFTPEPRTKTPQYQGPKIRGYHGGTVIAEHDAESVRLDIARMMNAGLSGKDLKKAILSRYSVESLRPLRSIIERAAADDGVQGHYFVDPSVYPDYGKGCRNGSKSSNRRASYILAGSSCTGCTLQTYPGYCSKYCKQMIRSVPQAVRIAAAERRSARVANNAPINDPAEQFGLEKPEIEIEPDPKVKSVDISISGPTID